MSVKDNKKKKSEPAVFAYPTCPYCEGARQYTAQFYLQEHIKEMHPEKRFNSL